MPDILIALMIGLLAGTIDIIPMILKKMYPFAILSTFILWLVAGIIIPFIDWGTPSWLTGALAGLMLSLPSVLIVWPRVKKMIIPMLITHVILGIGLGLMGQWLIP